MLRITGGKARGIPLKSPKGKDVRPATDQVRQKIFNALGPDYVAGRFLDLFAGTGAYGLEAFSRYGASGDFVEKFTPAVKCLEENINVVRKACGEHGIPLKVHRQNVSQFHGGEPVDLIFVDPPYVLWEEALVWLEKLLPKVSHPKTFLVLEHSGDQEINPTGWSPLRSYPSGKKGPCLALFQQR